MPTSGRTRQLAAVAGLFMAIACLTAGHGASAASAPPASTPTAVTPAAVPSPATAKVSWVRTGYTFDSPVQFLVAPDGINRFFVVERGGTVRVVVNGKVLPRPFVDVSRRTTTENGETGLDSIAFPPNFRANPWVYIAYSDVVSHALVIQKWKAPTARSNVLDPRTARTVLVIPHQLDSYGSYSHYSGQLAFGPDGYLYIGAGDGGCCGNPFHSAQNRGDLRGKILRIDVSRVCSGRYYCPVPSNAYGRVPGARPEIWAVGVRNPWRFSFDPANGDLWIGDVGDSSWEEIDVLNYRRTWANLGWSLCEGKHAYDGPCPTPSLTPPILDYCHADNADLNCNDTIGGDAVIGGVVYRGLAYPFLRGLYVFGDFGNGNIWLANRAGAHVLQAKKLPDVVAFGTDRKGAVFALSITDGNLYRMVASRT